MFSCPDDVRHMTDASSASIHRSRRAVCRGPIRTNLQPQLQCNPLTASGGINLRIPSIRLFKRNEGYSNIRHRQSLNISFNEIYEAKNVAASLVATFQRQAALWLATDGTILLPDGPIEPPCGLPELELADDDPAWLLPVLIKNLPKTLKIQIIRAASEVP
ncbi:unnamed protein product [Protopolystoma xenopodis]|uniref:Uncharacterized protein n=1 Tax=Protopolystoma xenopodis TaxID=117903 RepID=A0A3S5CH61_9PLAT|nr:unnamed protein product [Protopolystoma xenopodis]